MLEEAEALAPRCIICSGYPDTNGGDVTLLQCRHVVCARCWRVLRVDDVPKYICPIDMGESTWVEVDTALTQMTRTLHNGDLQNPEAAVELFKSQIYYWGVPCFDQEQCPIRDTYCPYNHVRGSQSPCPDGRDCPRKHRYCLYSHEPGEFGNVEYSSLAGVSELHSSLERREVSIPQNLGEVERVVVDSEDSDDDPSPIQRQERARTGHIYMKSESLYNYLVKSQPSRLLGLLYQYHVRPKLFKRHPLKIEKSYTWLHGTDIQMKEFSNDTSSQLEREYEQNPAGIVYLDQRTVHFGPMVMCLMDRAYVPVHRVLRYKTLTHAGCFQIETDPNTYKAINSEIQMLEMPIMVPNWVPGDVIKEVVNKCHLYIGEGHVLTGVKEDLLQARQIVSQARYPDKATHFRLKPSIRRDLVKLLAQELRLLILKNDLIIGREGDILHLLNGDLSVQLPIRQPQIDLLQRHHVQFENGTFYGRLDDLTAMMEEARIPALLGSYKHYEGQQFIGPQRAVVNAIAHSIPEAENGMIYQAEIVQRFPPVTDEAWYNLSGDNSEPELVEILPESPAYQRIQARFLKERSDLIIESVQEVHNKKAFAAFLMRKEEVKRRAKEPMMELFYRDHRKEDPKLIAMSADGFSNKEFTGSWGTGFEFTKYATQLLRTAYRSADQEFIFEVLLCQVLTGNVSPMKSDRDRISTPLAQANRVYHSVLGRGPVWTVYNHDMAYPRYLITLSEPPPGI